jgi:hypothetical protein
MRGTGFDCGLVERLEGGADEAGLRRIGDIGIGACCECWPVWRNQLPAASRSKRVSLPAYTISTALLRAICSPYFICPYRGVSIEGLVIVGPSTLSRLILKAASGAKEATSHSKLASAVWGPRNYISLSRARDDRWRRDVTLLNEIRVSAERSRRRNSVGLNAGGVGWVRRGSMDFSSARAGS